MVCITLEGSLTALLLVYVLSAISLGLVKGRKYLGEHPKEEKERDYFFHTEEITLALAGFALTALVLFISLRFENLAEFVAAILFFSIAFSTLTLSYIFMRIRTTRLFPYISNVMMDTGLLAIGCGFFIFFWQKLQWDMGIAIVYIVFISVFLALSLVDFYFYLEYWKEKESEQKQRRDG